MFVTSPTELFHAVLCCRRSRFCSDVLKARLGGAGPGRAASNASSSSLGQAAAAAAAPGPWGRGPGQQQAVPLAHIMMQVRVVGGITGAWWWGVLCVRLMAGWVVRMEWVWYCCVLACVRARLLHQQQQGPGVKDLHSGRRCPWPTS
jgi:hypothetical protein